MPPAPLDAAAAALLPAPEKTVRTIALAARMEAPLAERILLSVPRPEWVLDQAMAVVQIEIPMRQPAGPAELLSAHKLHAPRPVLHPQQVLRRPSQHHWEHSLLNWCWSPALWEESFPSTHHHWMELQPKVREMKWAEARPNHSAGAGTNRKPSG